MSEQVDGHLQTPASYNFNRETIGNYRSKSIDQANFHLWFKNDMYRSTYSHNHSPDSSHPRSSLIPGYGGFVPKNNAESIHAKTFANKTKQIFNDPSVNMNQSGLATTGFNVNFDALVDKSKLASSHKYGKTMLQRPNPAWTPAEWKSTTKDTYRPPRELGNPCYRETEKDLQTNKLSTKTSGYQQNRAYWDGNGWNPHPVLNPKESSTSEYRDRFNPEQDFHRKVNTSKLPKLNPTEHVYKFNK